MWSTQQFIVKLYRVGDPYTRMLEVLISNEGRRKKRAHWPDGLVSLF